MTHAQKDTMETCNSLESNSHGCVGQKGTKIIRLPPIKEPCTKQGGRIMR